MWTPATGRASSVPSTIFRPTSPASPISSRRSTIAPAALADHVIIIGTLGKSRIIDDLVKAGKIDTSQIAGKWESFFLQVVPNPLPDVSSGLVIAGSDKRGTIYGIYDLSEQIGVSPWYWWADVPVAAQRRAVRQAGQVPAGRPSVKYRGIFLNDEAPDLTRLGRREIRHGSAAARIRPIPANVANYDREFYARIFEVILRLEGQLPLAGDVEQRLQRGRSGQSQAGR